MAVSSQICLPVPVTFEKKLQVLIGQEAGWFQNWSGRCGDEQNLCDRQSINRVIQNVIYIMSFQSKHKYNGEDVSNSNKFYAIKM